jgi:ActR/RegA family two-component response regulator
MLDARPSYPPTVGGIAGACTLRRDLMSSRRKILLVEDESSISEPLAAALRREGFDPVVAATAAAALDAFKAPSPIWSCST